MPEDAVMDAAVDTALDTDTGAEPGGETGGQEDQATENAGADPGGQPAIEAPTKPLIDGGKLSAEAKKHLDELKAANPTLARALQRELFKGAELAKALPGGVREVQELRQTIEQLGGPNGVQEIQAEVNGWHQFDEQYMAGDPKAVEFMTSEPEGQEAFLKLMPSALQKFEALHPEGFSNYMAQVIMGTMGQHGIPLALERLADFIGDNPKAIEQYNKLLGFYQSMRGIAAKQVEVPKFKKDVPDDGRTQFEQERTAFEREKWKTETAGEQRQVFESEWARLASGRKLSASQDAAVKELFESRLNRAINGKHAETLQRYFQAKDKAGFLRYASSISKTEVPKALREAFDAVVPAKPGPRTNNGAPPAKNGQPALNNRGPLSGFTQVAAQPKTAEIDYRNPFNTPANFQAGKAVLIGGKKVMWQKQA